MNVSALMGLLQPYRGIHNKLVAEQSTGDIIQAITNAHHKHAADYARIAHLFKGANDRETARNIWEFLKSNIRYKIEPGERQTVKSPAALLAHGYGDCKHYSKFAAGVLQALNIPFAYRFASYKYFDEQPGHVFVVVHPGTSKEIWIDPVLPAFDYKKPYYHAKDKKMAIYSISGIGATKRTARREQRKTKQAARKAAGKTLGQRLKKGTRIVARVAAAPARNAFLLLVRINFGNLAVRLSNAWQKAPGRLQNFWEGLGGRMEALKKAFEKGRTKRRILGVETDAEIGAAPAAAAAAAAPILAAVAKFLKDVGIEPGELVQLGREAVNNKVQQLVKEKLIPQTERLAVRNEIAEQMDEQVQSNTMPVTYSTASSNTTAPANKNMIPLIVGGIAVAYLLTRKR